MYDVSLALGHQSILTTEKNYAHLVPGTYDRIRKNMGDITAGIDFNANPVLRAVG